MRPRQNDLVADCRAGYAKSSASAATPTLLGSGPAEVYSERPSSFRPKAVATARCPYYFSKWSTLVIYGNGFHEPSEESICTGHTPGHFCRKPRRDRFKEIVMAAACPILTPEERKASEIVSNAQRALMEKVHAAIAEAAVQVREQTLAAGVDLTPAPREYFDAVVHQQMYLTLCGATAGTFEGGDAERAIGLIRSLQQIANRYWGADIAVTPKT